MVANSKKGMQRPMNRRPKAVLLDYYGTAVRDDLSLVNRVACQIADAAETETTAHQVSTHWQDAVRVLRRRACGDTFISRREIDRRALERTLARFGARLNAEVLAAELDESRRRARPFDETVSVLSLCPVPVVVLANGARETLEENLRSTGLAFHDVITSEDVRAYKPRAVTWLKALGRLRLSPEKVLHVGDSLQTDIRGAREKAPEATIKIKAAPGKRVSGMPFQDAEGFELGYVILGGESGEDVVRKFEAMSERLPFAFEE